MTNSGKARVLSSPEEISEDLRRYVQSNDSIGVVNRGQQFLLTGMKTIIDKYGAMSHSRSKLKRLGYAQALVIVDVLGVLTKEEYDFLAAVNNLRNRVDHESYEPTPEDGRSVGSLLLQALRIDDERFSGAYGTEHFLEILAYAMSTVYNLLLMRAETLADKKLSAVSVEQFEGSSIALESMLRTILQHGEAGGEAIPPTLSTILKLLENVRKARVPAQPDQAPDGG